MSFVTELNLQCFEFLCLSNLEDGTIYVKWKRPIIYYNTIDFYIISFKASAWDYNRQFQINTSSEHLEIEVKLR